MSKSGTRAPNRLGSIRKRPDGRYEGRYTGPDGRQHSVYGKSPKAVGEALRAAQHRVDTGTWLEPSRMTVGEWLDVWLADYQGHTTGRTVATYTAVINRHMRSLYVGIRLSAFSPIHVRRLVSTMTKEKKAPATVKHARGILSACMNAAVEAGLISSNPVEGVKPPRMIRQEYTIIDRDHIPEFIRAANETKYPEVLTFLLMTGLRVGELRGLRWADVDLDAGTLRVERQLHALSAAVREFRPPKDGEARTIHLTPQAVELLKAHRRAQLQRRMAAGWTDDEITRDLVFRKENGQNFEESTMHRLIERVRVLMDMPKLRLHDLRHSYAVAALRSGVDVKTVQNNLGHKHASITLDTYAAYTDDAGKSGAEKLGKYWSDAVN